MANQKAIQIDPHDVPFSEFMGERFTEEEFEVADETFKAILGWATQYRKKDAAFILKIKRSGASVEVIFFMTGNMRTCANLFSDCSKSFHIMFIFVTLLLTLFVCFQFG